MTRLVTRRELLRGILSSIVATIMAACNAPTTQLSGTSTPHPVETPSLQPTETFTPRPTETPTVQLTATPSPTQTPDVIKMVQASIEPVIFLSGGETRIAQGEALVLQIKSEPTDRVPAFNDKRPPAKLPDAGWFDAIQYNRDGSATISMIDGYQKYAQAEVKTIQTKNLNLVWDTSRVSLILEDANGDAVFEFIQFEDADYNVQGAWVDATPKAGIPEITTSAYWFNWDKLKTLGRSYAEDWINKMNEPGRARLEKYKNNLNYVRPGKMNNFVKTSPCDEIGLTFYDKMPLVGLGRTKINGKTGYIIGIPFLRFSEYNANNPDANLNNTHIWWCLIQPSSDYQKVLKWIKVFGDKKIQEDGYSSGVKFDDQMKRLASRDGLVFASDSASGYASGGLLLFAWYNPNLKGADSNPIRSNIAQEEGYEGLMDTAPLWDQFDQFGPGVEYGQLMIAQQDITDAYAFQTLDNMIKPASYLTTD